MIRLNGAAQTNRTKSPFVLPCKQNNICKTNESNEEQSSNWKQNRKKNKKNKIETKTKTLKDEYK